MRGWGLLLHDGDAVAALYVLRWILACGEEYGCDEVGGVRVEASDAAGHGAADEIFRDVELDEGVDVAL